MGPGSHIDLLVPLLADEPDLSVLGDSDAWAVIRQNAARYAVGPLIAYAVRSHVTGDDRAWCDRILVESWTRHERMLRHLESLVELFAGSNIPTLCLKGPLLACRYYDPPFLRKPSMDLDLAIIEKDLPAAAEVLTEAGYTLAMPISEALRVSHHVGFRHPSRPFTELHFRLSHQARGIRVEELFERAVTCAFPGGREAKVLGDADQLLHLVLHLAHSRFGTLFHLHEVRRAFRAAGVEARKEAVQRIIDRHYCGALLMADVAVRTCFGESLLPSDIRVPRTWLHGRLNEKLYRRFERASAPDSQLTPAARLQGRWLEFQITDSPSEALRFLKVCAQTARFQIANRTWSRVKTLSYTPSPNVR
jgi:hypothetical protein